jgi:hypothetical protein
MKLIAHRGLFEGPSKELENHPDQIQKAWALGFDCEIDIRVVDGQLWLGHDGPQYKITHNFLELGPLWIHAKNFAALRYLSITNLNYFWHQEDDYTLTSRGYIWAYPGKQVDSRSVMVCPEMVDPDLSSTIDVNCFGICSDYLLKIQSQRP